MSDRKLIKDLRQAAKLRLLDDVLIAVVADIAVQRNHRGARGRFYAEVLSACHTSRRHGQTECWKVKA